MLKQKKCEDHCPRCKSDDCNIEYGVKELCGSEIRQMGDCQNCGLVFYEYYAYKETEWQTEQEDFRDKIHTEVEK